jgi:SAM-dependent methyltransferase
VALATASILGDLHRSIVVKPADMSGGCGTRGVSLRGRIRSAETGRTRSAESGGIGSAETLVTAKPLGGQDALMDGYDESTYGDAIADVYDDWYQDLFDVEGTADLLAALGDGGRVLELAIGTGRVALPLARRGVDVHGVDASERMVAKLRAKPGGDRIPVTLGNFVDVPVEGPFRLIYLLFTTLFALPSQAEQIRCLRETAARLEPGGSFVMDAFVPDLTRYRNNQTLTAERVGINEVRLDASRHDPVEQRIESSHVLITNDSVRLFPVSVRYAWPAELDAMAMVAGLHLVNRWANYDRSPFTATSTRHVSVYSKPGM